MTPIVHTPHLAPYDYLLFPRLKRNMNGKSFATGGGIKFSVKLRKSASEKIFKEEHADVKNDGRTEHLKTQRTWEHLEKVQQLVRSDRRLSTRVTAEELNLDSKKNLYRRFRNEGSFCKIFFYLDVLDREITEYEIWCFDFDTS